MDLPKIRTYKAIGILTWEIDLPEGISHEDAIERAKEFFDEIVTRTPGVSQAIRIDKIKRQRAKVVRLGEFEPKEILSQLTVMPEKKEIAINDEIYKVRFNSPRYFVFRNNLRCVSCGLEGTKMILEKFPNQFTPHFNLYGIEDDELVLITKDHIHSKASGGPDRPSNYQTMCAICNNLKGPLHLPLHAIAELRQFYNIYKDKFSRKELNKALREIRRKYKEIPTIMESCRRKRRGPLLAVRVDLNIFRNEDGTLFARSVYDEQDVDSEWIACLKAGQPMECLASSSGILKIKLGDTHFDLYEGLATGGDDDE